MQRSHNNREGLDTLYCGVSGPFTVGGIETVGLKKLANGPLQLNIAILYSGSRTVDASRLHQAATMAKSVMTLPVKAWT